MLHARRSTDIRELAIDTPRVPHALAAELEQLRAECYDTERGLWKTSPSAKDDFFRIDDQLLGSLVEDTVRPGDGKRAYARLRQSAFRKSQDITAIWHLYLGNGLGAGDKTYTAIELLGVALEARVDRVDAQARYERLRQRFHTRTRGWQSGHEQDGREMLGQREVSVYLYDLLVRHELGKDVSGDLKDLREDFYDPAHRMWKRFPDNDGWQLRLEDQLLGVIVQASANLDEGRRAYALLRSSSLYDQPNERWRSFVNADGTAGAGDLAGAFPVFALDLWARALLAKNDDAKRLDAERIPELLTID